MYLDVAKLVFRILHPSHLWNEMMVAIIGPAILACPLSKIVNDSSLAQAFVASAISFFAKLDALLSNTSATATSSF